MNWERCFKKKKKMKMVVRNHDSFCTLRLVNPNFEDKISYKGDRIVILELEPDGKIGNPVRLYKITNIHMLIL